MCAIGNRVFRGVKRPEREIVELFRGIPSSNINDEMNRLYCMHDYIRLVNTDKAVQLLGIAITVKVPAGDNLMFHLALDMAQKGDVVVVDGANGSNRSLAGEIMMRHSQGKGIAGWVCDGAIRDFNGAQELTMPIYASGVTPQGPWKHGPGEINVPIACGGQVVFPGDIIVGDRDGIVVIRQQDALEIARLAKKHKNVEDEIMEQIAKNIVAYCTDHVSSTEKRMAGKHVEFINDSFANIYK